MTGTLKTHQSIQYPEQTVRRAERAMQCAPFRVSLFAIMVQQSVPLKAIAQATGVHNQYTDKPLSELRVENELLWLIQVGLLRREVDGQGLTDSFRVTPLGRQLVSKWHNGQGAERYTPTWSERFQNRLNRWLQLPV